MDLRKINLDAAAAIETGDLARAEALIGQLQAARPGHPQILYLLGLLRVREGRHAEAIPLLEMALRASPSNVSLLVHLGNALQALARFEEAISLYNAALNLNPGLIDALNNRGNALAALNRFDQALTDFDHAIALAPDNIHGRTNRAAALYHLGRYGAALTEYEHVGRLQPDLPGLVGRTALAALYECDWIRMEHIKSDIQARLAAGEPVLEPWTLISYGADNAMLQQAARSAMRAAVPQPPKPLWKGERYSHDRIRLVYLSADFGAHAVGFQLVEVLERHDRARFEVIAISSGLPDDSPTRARIVAACDQFHDLSRATDPAVAEKLRALEVDIAVDLSGHTWGTRIGALEWRPAPVQATWLGYPGTIGAREIDFLIGDAIVTPPEHQPFYDETILPLPRCFFPLDSHRTIGLAPAREAEGLPREGFVFCCFNRNWKITPALFDIWLRLLEKTPGSVLWLRSHTPGSDAALRQRARAQGTDPARLVFADRAPIETHLARHALADLFLDTLPYGAHATAADALWAGLPVLTCLGETFAGRVGASLLTAAGLPELVTYSRKDYEALALALAHDPPRLRAIRERLKQTREQTGTGFFDMNAFTRALEAGYEDMIRRRLQAGNWAASAGQS